MTKKITININGVQRSAEVEPRLLLVHFLRENAALTGTHIGCETSLCGACTVLMDGRAVKSCTVLAVQADGRNVTTVEGLAAGDQPHPSDSDIREALNGNVCRCTGYQNIVAAVRNASRKMSKPVAARAGAR